MNVLNAVTLKTMGKNKVRTAVTVIGVVISVAMICAVTTFISSFANYLKEESIYSSGEWHVYQDDVTWKDAREASEDPRVGKTAVLHPLGYALLEECENAYKPYLYIAEMNGDFSEIMPVHLTYGRLPAAAGEIILPQHLYENGGVKYDLGDTLTVFVGDRVSDGHILGPHSPLITGENPDETPESLDNTKEMSYKVVGFYKRPDFEDYWSPGYTALTVMTSLEDEYVCDVYYDLLKPRTVYEFMSDNGISGSTNWELLAYSGVSRYNSFYTAIGGMAVIVLLIIVLGSVCLIYNAFSISVSQRTRQLGLLSSVGATRKQIKKSVLFEAFAVAAAGIPLGILSGVGGIGAALFLLRDKFTFFADYNMPITVHVSWVSVAAAAVISALTILISAWIPMKKASRITAIDAIRMSRDIRVRPGSTRPNRLARKLFGFEGVLALRYFRRSRRSYRSTIISLFMSVVLFISASAFCMYLTGAVRDPYESEDFDIVCHLDMDLSGLDPRALYNSLQACAGIEDSAMHSYSSNAVKIPAYDCTDHYRDLAGSGAFGYYLGNERAEGDGVFYDGISLYFVEDGKYRELLSANGLPADKYTDASSPLGILCDDTRTFIGAEGRYVQVSRLKDGVSRIEQVTYSDEYPDYYISDMRSGEAGMEYILRDSKTGDVITVPEQEYERTTALEIGFKLTEKPFYVSNGFSLLYPLSSMTAVTGSPPGDMNMVFRSSAPSATFSEMSGIAAEFGERGIELTNIDELYDSSRNVILVFKVFSYGFIVLISLIAIANVFNTITTNVGLRRREFAILRSVGTDIRGLSRMTNYECVIYGLRALAAGLPVSAALTYLIWLSVNSGFMTDFRLPWSSIATAIVSVFATVFISMLYSMKSIRNDNLIDALKNENM